ncbi:MAG TPA: hypothetical protein VG105_06030 [Paraburkholderia sp.]|jgi:hypothetical protein|nr:hypothetical protein [Paraburkholderia sp.]
MPTQKRAESDAPFAARAGSLVTRRVLVEAVIVGGQWVVDSIWFNVGVVDAVDRIPRRTVRAPGIAIASSETRRNPRLPPETSTCNDGCHDRPDPAPH